MDNILKESENSKTSVEERVGDDANSSCYTSRRTNVSDSAAMKITRLKKLCSWMTIQGHPGFLHLCSK
jgi:hypothetical protein